MILKFILKKFWYKKVQGSFSFYAFYSYQNFNPVSMQAFLEFLLLFSMSMGFLIDEKSPVVWRGLMVCEKVVSIS